MSDAAEVSDAEGLLGDSPDGEAEEKTDALARDRDLLGRRDPNSPIRKHLDELWDTIKKGFEDQSDRADDIEDFWDCYNCVANDKRYYNGVAEIYWPIIHDAVEARATRFTNQLFPQSGRYVEAISADDSSPTSIVALLDHYIRQARLKTQVAKPLCRHGDIEGQYNLYVDWNVVDREIVSRETHGPIIDMQGVPVEAEGEEIDDITVDEVSEGAPGFEVLHDKDVQVLPVTVDTIEQAFARGGSVTIVRRWTKADIDRMAEEGAIREDEAKDLKEKMRAVAGGFQDKDTAKQLAEHAGIRAKGAEVTVWETWHNLPLDDKGKFQKDGKLRLCRIFFGPEKMKLGAKRNPNWNDRCNLLSAPAKKVGGLFKGPSLIAPVASLQYEANDAVNEGADAATLSAAPIVTRDTSKGNGPLIYNMGAVWDMPPDSVKILTFPDLTPRAQVRVQMAIQAIFQTLGVNPAMLPQQTGRPGAKRNQAEIAMEQQVDLLTTAEAVSVLEEGIFTPAMGWCVDLDYQYRDTAIAVRAFGSMGLRAQLEAVEPLRNRRQYTFVWRGGEQVRQNVAMQQQGTAWVNVLRDPMLRAELAKEGYQLHLGPIIEYNTQSIFGPFLGSQVIIDQRAQLTMGPEIENELMGDGHSMPVHPLDQDVEHLKSHMQDKQMNGDPHGTKQAHIGLHLQQMQTKAMAMQQQQMQQGGGGGGPAPGGPGRPQPGAVPAGPRLLKPPPGAIHADRLPAAGVTNMQPRKT
jgi:hypothetical protein